MYRDFYDLLGTTPDADNSELKKAYRETVRDFHPDLNDSENAAQEFQIVRKAYDALSDEETREEYDTIGHHAFVDKHFGGIDVFEFEEIEEEPEEKRGGISLRTIRVSRGDLKEERWKDPIKETPQTRTFAERKQRPTRKQAQARPGSKTVDMPFRPTVRRDVLGHMGFVLLAAIMYLIGVIQFLNIYSSEVDALLDSFSQDSNFLVALQGSIAGGRYGIPIPSEYIGRILNLPVQNPELLLLPLGMLLLPLSISYMVVRLGDERTWSYVVGALFPIFALMFNVSGILTIPHIEVLFYIGVPTITVVVFYLDVFSHIIKQFYKYYRKKYLVDYL